MSFCCHPTRRQFLRWAGLTAATPFLIALDDMPRAYGQTSASVALPINLELVTLTETSAILTWFTGDPTRPDVLGRLAPMPADTQVLLAPVGAAPREVFYDATPTPYHYVELTGIEPGASYSVVAQSGGVPAVPSINVFGDPFVSNVGTPSQIPLRFTTPQPPQGAYLFTIALCNDLHLGETVAGLGGTYAGVGLPPGVSQIDGEPPYAEVMAAALAKETRARGADLLLVGGDVSSEAQRSRLVDAKAYLDRFGRYEEDYYVVRGNHDRPHTTSAAAQCGPSPFDAQQHDCFRDAFFPSGSTWFTREAFGLRVLGLDTYDKVGDGGDEGVMSQPQMEFVRDELARDRDQPTIVVGHHPITLESSVTTVPPLVRGYDFNRDQGSQLESEYANSPGVFLHHAGHTHRNKQSSSPVATRVAFHEVAAAKEYPGGFSLLRVHAGGYALNYYKFRDALAQEWTERSRPEYLGAAPMYSFGANADRNTVVTRDFSGLRSAVAARTISAPSSPQPVATIPATGRSSDALIAGAAAAAAATAASWLRRQSRPDISSRA